MRRLKTPVFTKITAALYTFFCSEVREEGWFAGGLGAL